MKHLELFSGIGGFRRALDLLSNDGVMSFDCVGYSEIDAMAKKTYQVVYDTTGEIDVDDIVEFTLNPKRVKSFPKFELLTGGFPCQTFSMMGKQSGFNESRGQMFFRIMDILKIKSPKFVLLENVKNLYTHDNGRTFAKITSELASEGYKVFSDIFNTVDFHLPQKRSRVLIFATKGRIPKAFSFSSELVKKCFDKYYTASSTLHFDTTIQLLEKEVSSKYFLSEKIKPTILSNGSAGFSSKSDINQKIARPLTATMHKMHRACQDNYYSQDFIASQGKVNHVNDYTKEQLAKLSIRKLIPQEAFALQGFPKTFASKASLAGVTDGALYKQAGNAVSVNTIYAVMYYLITSGAIYE